MALVIRLSRTGTKKKNKFRIVVTDKRYPRDGKYIEILGFWNPHGETGHLKVDLEKARNWITQGALPSPTVLKILKKAGI